MITYTIDPEISVEQFIDVLQRSTLAERRPVHDRACMSAMLEHSNLQVAAWHEDRLVGIARSLTDFRFCCYLADLAVDVGYQKKGIGIELQKQTRGQLAPGCMMILLSAPAAASYYPGIGYTRHESCWVLNGDLAR